MQKEIGVFVSLLLQLAGCPPATHHCVSEELTKKQLTMAWALGQEKQKEGYQQVSNFLGK